MKDKIKIEITECNYAKSHKNGALHKSVGYGGKGYGSLCPCDTDEDVRVQIEWAEKTIKAEGDIPIVNWGKVKPISTKNNLVGWFK